MMKEFEDVFFLNEVTSSDQRGLFCKFFDNSILKGRPFNMRQQNFVLTNEKNTFRGLHYQKGAYAETKIFRVLKGKIQLFFFDTRTNSHTSFKSSSIILDHYAQAIYLPKGYATGYLTLESNTQVLYMSDQDYMPEFESGLKITDPILNIDLETDSFRISEKDQNWSEWK